MKVKMKVIDKAILNHAKWKKRLKKAIKQGYLGAPVAVIRDPHACKFGRFLRDSDSDSIFSRHYQEVAEIHKKFHEKAAEVANLAIDGKTDEAIKEMQSNSDYDILSMQLINALANWKYDL